MKKLTKHLKLIATASIVLILVYFFARIYFFSHQSGSAFDTFFSALLLLAETHMIVHSVGFAVNALRLSRPQPLYDFRKIDDDAWPSVAVVVPAKNEPLEVLEQTFVTLNSLDYPNKTLYFLEDSTEEPYLSQDKELARRYGLNFFHPDLLHGAKAGIINDFIKSMPEKYLAIFDADQNPLPDFLKKTVSIAESSGNIAFVQTPQYYHNFSDSPIANGATLQQAIFYESICEAKGRVNAMFCCGTNVLFRLEALREVDGFDESSITEDFATSVKLHMKGWRSIYYNHVRAFGMSPEALGPYFKQQIRWSAGCVGVFKKLLRHFLKNPSAMKPVQWWEYLLSSTYYFVGWSFLVMLLSPALFLLFGVPSFFMDPLVYVITFLPYLAMTSLLFYTSMSKRHYSARQIYQGIILNMLNFPILIASTAASLLGRRLTFTVTDKGGTATVLPWQKLWPWHLTIAILFLALMAGARQLATNPYAIGINMLWCLYHLFIVSRIYFLNAIPKKAEQAYANR